MPCSFNGTLLISVLPPLLIVELVLGLLGNGFALWIFWFHLKHWKSSTVLLFNLAISDLLLNMVLPFRASYYIYELNWMFGDAACNICLFMLAMNRTGSAMFLMAIALDRYMRVIHPHHPVNSLSVPKAACAAAALWMIAISMTAHVFTLQHINTTYCESFMVYPDPDPTRIWHKMEFIFSFIVPLLVILYCTFKITVSLRRRQLAQHSKIKKALWFITVVVVLFIVCFLPSSVTQLLIWFKSYKVAKTFPESEVCSAFEDLTTAFFIMITFTYLNSVLDPVVYYFSSPTFKNILRRSVHLPQGGTVESTEKKTRETCSRSVSQL